MTFKVPPSVTLEAMERLCEYIASGMTIMDACKQEGMPKHSCIYLAIAASKEYMEMYTRARESQCTVWEEEILAISDDSSLDRPSNTGRYDHEHITRSRLRVETRKWLLSKRMARTFGDRALREITGLDGGPVQMQLPAADLSKLTDEELKQLEAIQEKLKS